ncbi:MAG: hypothetical protein R3B93_19585 [Bacteroidia bacterium]
MISKILSTATALPRYSFSQEDSLAYVEKWVQNLPDRERRKILKIFQFAQVDKRYTVRDMDQMLRGESFQERNNLYIEEAIRLGEIALKKALDKAGLKPEDLDYIITTSCTGFMIPSVDAYLINKLRMRQDIIRLPVTEMGCAAGTSALIYAHDLLKAQPHKRAAILAIEFPSCTLVREDLTMTNIVSTAIFGDGVACTILGPSEELKPAIVGTEMFHFYDAIDMMGYDVRNTGYHMVLDKKCTGEN